LFRTVCLVSACLFDLAASGSLTELLILHTGPAAHHTVWPIPAFKVSTSKHVQHNASCVGNALAGVFNVEALG